MPFVMKIYMYDTIHQQKKTMRSIKETMFPKKIQILDTIRLPNDRFGYQISYDEKKDKDQTSDDADNERMSYYIFFDLKLKIVIVMGSGKHRKHVLHTFMQAVEGDSWKYSIKDTQITNSEIRNLIARLREEDKKNHVKRITMRSDTGKLMMELKDVEKKVPYFELDFGLATSSAEDHPLMDSFVANAKSMGFVMRLSSCRGMREKTNDGKTNSFVIKPKYTFRRYSNIPYGGWLLFMDIYLVGIIDQQDREVNEYA